jgi:cell division protein FtsZ
VAEAGEPEAIADDTLDAQPVIQPTGRPAFIPPRPARPGEVKASQSVPEPFAVAAMENARSEPPKPRRKTLSLFERVTRTGRQQAAANAAKLEIKPVVTTSAPPMAGQLEQPGQPSLEGLGSADTPSPSAAEEAMLQIPAFLRRQAN